MSLHPIVLGLAATLLVLASGAFASEPLDTQSSPESVSSEPTASAASGQPQPADASKASPAAESTNETSAEDAAVAADATAEGVTETIEQPAPRDWAKAKRKDIAAYNATVEPDHRIVCRVNTSTAARTGKRLCLTAMQWRELR